MDPTAIDHFPFEEFACHDGTPYPSEWVDDRLAQLKGSLEIIRTAWAGMGAPSFAVAQNGVDVSPVLGIPTGTINGQAAPTSCAASPTAVGVQPVTAFPLQFHQSVAVAGAGLTTCTGFYLITGYYA